MISTKYWLFNWRKCLGRHKGDKVSRSFPSPLFAPMVKTQECTHTHIIILFVYAFVPSSELFVAAHVFIHSYNIRRACMCTVQYNNCVWRWCRYSRTLSLSLPLTVVLLVVFPSLAVSLITGYHVVNYAHGRRRGSVTLLL